MSARAGIHAEPTVDEDLTPDDSVSSMTVLDPDNADMSISFHGVYSDQLNRMLKFTKGIARPKMDSL